MNFLNIGASAESGTASRTEIIPAFGFTEHLRVNIGKIVGYIPLIGTIVGIARTAFALQANAEVSDKVPHISRGVIESLGLGVLLLPVDLVVTVVMLVASRRRSDAAVVSTGGWRLGSDSLL